MKFPIPPHIKLIEKNIKIQPEDGFLRIQRSDVTFHYPNGETSTPYTVDRCVRRVDDAVAIIAWYYKDPRVRQQPMIYLRSAIRPALYLRDFTESGIPEDSMVGNLWELPAGCVEKDETGIDGVLKAASREALEEIGFAVDPVNVCLLGDRTFSAVGMAGERIFFAEMKVNPKTKIEPTLDGGPFEAYGEVFPISLYDALVALETGQIYDSKTEIGIRRFADKML